MNEDKNIKLYIEELLETIVYTKHIEKRYHEMAELRNNLAEELDLKLHLIDTNKIVNYIKDTDYVFLFNNLDLHEAANVIFLKRIEEKDIIEFFKKVSDGINENNYLNKIYSYNETYKEKYGIDLNNIDLFFKDCKYFQKMEIMANLATFIESYYKTTEGKNFIENYKNTIHSSKDSQQYFEELFEKMNQSSIRPLFYKNNNKYIYTAAGAGSLDGFFIMFDEKNNLTFNVSTTVSPNVKIEGTSVLRHAVTSKIISEAIIEHIDKILEENKLYDPLFGDTKESLKKTRAEYFNNYIKNDLKYKNTFISKALLKKIKNLNLDFIEDFNITDEALKSGEIIETITKKLNQSDPTELINRNLKISGVVSNKEIKDFFSEKNNDGFTTNFITEVKDVKSKKLFEYSSLNTALNDHHLNIYELKTYLQNVVLKEIALQEFGSNLNKNAIDLFYDHIVTRRVFSEANQLKINQNSFSLTVERFLLKHLLLNNENEIQENSQFLTEIDKSNIKSYFTYFISANQHQDFATYTQQDSYTSEIKDKLNKLGANIETLVFLEKINKEYNIEKAADLSVIEKNNSIIKDQNEEIKLLKKLLEEARNPQNSETVKKLKI